MALSRRNIHIIQVLLLLLLIGLTVVILWPFQKALDRSMLEFRHQLIEYLEGRTGRNITYSSISPAVFRHLEIRDLKIFDPGSPDEALLVIRKLRITYNLFDLFSGEPLQAVREIRLENTALGFNLQQDQDLLRLVRDLTTSPTPGPAGELFGEKLNKGLVISGRNLSFSFVDGGRIARIDRLFFDIHREEKRFSFEVRGDAGYSDSRSDTLFSEFQSYLSASGGMDLSGRRGDFSLMMRDIQSSLFDLPRITFFVEYSPSRVQVRKIQDREPFDLELAYEAAGRRLRLSFLGEDFRPSGFFLPRGALTDYRPWFDAVLSGNAEAAFNLDLSDLDYRGDLLFDLSRSELPVLFDGRINFEGNTRRIAMNPLYIESDRGRLTFQGDILMDSLLPSGGLRLRDVILPTGAFLNGDLDFRRSGSTVTAGGGLRVGDVLFPGLSGNIGRNGDDWEYDFLVPVESADTGRGYVSLEGGFYADTGFLQNTGRIQDIPLDASVRLFSGRQTPELLNRQNLRWSSSFFHYQEGDNYAFYLPNALVDHPQDPNRRITFQFSGSNEGFDLNVDSLLYNQYQAKGAVNLQSDPDEGIRFAATATLQDIPYQVRGSYGDGRLVLQGDYIETFLIDLGDTRRFYIKTRDFPIPFTRETSHLDLTSRGYYRDFGYWLVRFENSSLRNFPFTRGDDSLSLSMVADPNRINIYNIEYSDDISAVRGNGYFALDSFIPGDFLSLRGDGWLQLFSRDSEEQYQAVLSLEDGQLESDFSVRNAPLRRFGESPVQGNFSGDVTLTGALEQPDIYARFELEEGELNQDPFNFRTVFTLDSERMDIREFELEYLGMNLQQGRGALRFQEGDVEFRGELRLPFQEDMLRSTVELSMDTAAIPQRLGLDEIIRNPFDGRLSVRDIQLGNDQKEPWEISFGYDGELFAFYGGPGNSVSGTLDKNREFSLALVEPLPLQLRLNGSLEEGNINAELEQITLDVEPLQGGFRFPYFYLNSGTVSGENIKVSGPMNDPDFDGLLFARDISAESPVIPEAVGPFDGQLRLEEKTLSINNLSLPVGTGSVNADLSFAMEHWVPATYDIRIRTGPNRGVHVKTDIGQLKLDGYAIGSFNILGDRSGTELGGRLTLSSAVLTLTNEELPTPPPSSPHTLRTDFTFITGRSVEFLWPSANLPILRSFAKTGQEMTVKYDSGSETLAVLGDVEIQGGIILYFQRNFFITEGAVRFNENEIKFDPLLSARAELREIDEEGKSVQIFLVVDERPFSQFSPRFEATPSKTDAEIAALLGYSIFGGSTGEPITPSDALIQTSDLLIGQLGIVRSFEQSMKEIFNLDLFSIRTQILQNILLDRMVVEEQSTQHGSIPSNQLGRYLDNTTLFLGKYFGDDVFLEAMLQVQSNEQFFSTYSGEDIYSLETEISLEWKTPFFLLDVAVYPDFRDIVSSITTAKVGLSWSLSF
ncbi:hypothetical protein B4O97_03300 [Marispirochaeta aestuarii]|uniref:Translocation and assembly module TamB C-terminal domain-containing protein n=1 Tax=Marispirochaeta aestuarii TaxID=1963862 RepID=A0A1Y1S157_9SPIO|nr:translocation/assembly module TamB domain-containing protein [Marispirochaeta aestuarii]ORC37229.1 hypothetical protein B4O97_03300 [Marispirochaeta aestuarii]